MIDGAMVPLAEVEGKLDVEIDADAKANLYAEEHQHGEHNKSITHHFSIKRTNTVEGEFTTHETDSQEDKEVLAKKSEDVKKRRCGCFGFLRAKK